MAEGSWAAWVTHGCWWPWGQSCPCSCTVAIRSFVRAVEWLHSLHFSSSFSSSSHVIPSGCYFKPILPGVAAIGVRTSARLGKARVGLHQAVVATVLCSGAAELFCCLSSFIFAPLCFAHKSHQLPWSSWEPVAIKSGVLWPPNVSFPRGCQRGAFLSSSLSSIPWLESLTAGQPAAGLGGVTPL